MQPGVVFVKTSSTISRENAIKTDLKRGEALMRLHRHEIFDECFMISITISVGRFHREAMLNDVTEAYADTFCVCIVELNILGTCDTLLIGSIDKLRNMGYPSQITIALNILSSMYVVSVIKEVPNTFSLITIDKLNEEQIANEGFIYCLNATLTEKAVNLHSWMIRCAFLD